MANVSSPPSARTVAGHVLLRIAQDSAFAVAALEAELNRAAQLDPRDRALATELVYGTLRVLPWLDERIAAFVPRGLASMDPRVRVILEVAAYQLFFLERVPAFAAVHAAVEEARRGYGAKVAGFANAVLRKVAADASRRRPSLQEAVVASAAPWLRDALAAVLGAEGAARFLEEGAAVPPTGIRVLDPQRREEWLTQLQNACPDGQLEAGRWSPWALQGRGLGRLQVLPGFAEGQWFVQEEGSQVVAMALGAQPGERVLDACAGRGNKTSMMAQLVGAAGFVDAADLHPAKLQRLQKELARLGMAPREVFGVDWAVGAGDVSLEYDRVLVDAPCSGIGTLRRRPDLALRRTPDTLANLAATQKAILSNVATRVRPGGRLVYAVCSILWEESESVVEDFLTRHPQFEATSFDNPVVHGMASGQSTLRLLPHMHGTDGYYLASFRRVSGAG